LGLGKITTFFSLLERNMWKIIYEEIWRTSEGKIVKHERNMKKYEGSMKKYRGNVKKHVGNMKEYVEGSETRKN